MIEAITTSLLARATYDLLKKAKSSLSVESFIKYSIKAIILILGEISQYDSLILS
jgi:hypothetical protein